MSDMSEQEQVDRALQQQAITPEQAAQLAAGARSNQSDLLGSQPPGKEVGESDPVLQLGALAQKLQEIVLANSQALVGVKAENQPPIYRQQLQMLADAIKSYIQETVDRGADRSSAEQAVAAILNRQMPKIPRLAEMTQELLRYARENGEESGKGTESAPSSPTVETTAAAAEQAARQARTAADALVQELKQAINNQENELGHGQYEDLPPAIKALVVGIRLNLEKIKQIAARAPMATLPLVADNTDQAIEDLLDYWEVPGWLPLPFERRRKPVGGIVTEQPPLISPEPPAVAVKPELVEAPVVVETATTPVEVKVEPPTVEQPLVAQETEKPPGEVTVSEFFYNGYLGPESHQSTMFVALNEGEKPSFKAYEVMAKHKPSEGRMKILPEADGVTFSFLVDVDSDGTGTRRVYENLAIKMKNIDPKSLATWGEELSQIVFKLIEERGGRQKLLDNKNLTAVLSGELLNLQQKMRQNPPATEAGRS
jgi:hypothetical protein